MSFLVPSNIVNRRGGSEKMVGGVKRSADGTAKVSQSTPSVSNKPQKLTFEVRLKQDVCWTEEFIGMSAQLPKIEDIARKEQMCTSMLDLLTKIIDNKYDSMIREDALSVNPETMKGHSQQLDFLMEQVDEMHRIKPFNADWIRWTMSKLLLSLTSRVVHDRLSGHFQSKLIGLVSLLKKEDKEALLDQFCDQMHGVVSGVPFLSLYKDSPSLHPLFRVDIDCKSVIGGATAVLSAIVDMLTHSNIDFSSLSTRHLLQLWLTLFHLARDRDIRAQHASFKLMHTLLMAERASIEVVRVVVDHSIALLKVLVPVSESNADLRDSADTILKSLSDKLQRPAKSRLLNGLHTGVVVDWAAWSTALVLTHRGESGLHSFSTACIRLIVALKREAAAKHEVMLVQLAEPVKVLVEDTLKQQTMEGTCREKVGAWLTFLLYTDDVTGQSTLSSWVATMTDSLISSFSACGRFEASLRTRQLVLAALTDNKTTSSSVPSTPNKKGLKLLQKLLPGEDRLIEYIEIAAKEKTAESGAAILKALFDLVAQLIPQQLCAPATAVAILSLPWLTDQTLVMDTRRHFHSLPLLKEMIKLAKSCREAIVLNSACVRECTLPPLSSLPRPLHSEWRRNIFNRALQLVPSRSSPSEESVSLVKSALSSLPAFVASVEISAYQKILAAVVELIDADDISNCVMDVCLVLGSVSRSLCALDERTRVMAAVKDVDCKACTRLVSENVCSPRSLELPPSLDRLLVRVFNHRLTEFEMAMRWEAYSVLFALLCHVSDVLVKCSASIEASLVLITDQDTEVRSEYETPFKVIVSSNPSDKLLQKIKQAFEVPDSDQEKVKFEESAPFLRLCATECDNAEFVMWARLELYRRTLQFHESSILRGNSRLLHSTLAARDAEIAGNTRRVFARQARSLSTVLAREMLSVAEDLRFYENEETREEERKRLRMEQERVCDSMLRVAADIWGFDGINSLLQACASHVVAECFPVSEGQQKKDVANVLDRIRAHMNWTQKSLVGDFFPSILERLQSSSTKSQLTFEFLKEYGGMTTNDLFSERRYHCGLFVLRTLSRGEQRALDILKMINSQLYQGPFSLTKVLKIRCEYLGHFLSFRRSLLDDDHYELRECMLNSLQSIINLVESQFLDETASKMLVVLRATTAIGEKALPVWTTFVERLGNDVLIALLPQILIAVQPLFRFESCTKLLATIFDNRQALRVEQSDAFERAVLILLEGGGDEGNERIGRYLRRAYKIKPSPEEVIKGCALMLRDEGETVGRVVLRRLESVLDGRPLRDNVAAIIIPALLHAVRTCGSDAEVRLAASRCLGQVGAVDPGRLGLSLEQRRRELQPTPNTTVSSNSTTTVSASTASTQASTSITRSQQLFITSSNNEFYVDLMIRVCRLYANLMDADMIDIASYGIQSLLTQLVGSEDRDKIFARLPDDCKRDIEPFKSSSLTSSHDVKPLKTEGQPLVHVVGNFPDWLLQCFMIAVGQIRGRPLCDIFKALKWLVFTKDTAFARHILPHAIIAVAVMEGHEETLKKYAAEMIAVLKNTMKPESASWVRLAAHVVFSCIDVLERFAVHRRKRRGKDDKELDRCRDLITRVCSEKYEDGQLLVVAAAEKCQCLLRALRWCEQFAIPTGAPFDRSPYYTLERLYMQLTDVDGVAGAFESIAMHTSPTVDERILALEANGDYTEALPLYSLSSEQKELQLLKCLLRLNQPQLALSIATTMEKDTKDDACRAEMEAAQLEAASHLRDWSRLDRLLDKDGADPLRGKGKDAGWGAACASIMATINHRDGGLLTMKTDRARTNLVDRLTAIAIEDSDTYAQAYKYITQLHMLAEVDDAKDSLGLMSEHPRSAEAVQAIMTHWQARSEAAAQCASVIEPMLRVRRELLRVAGPRRNESVGVHEESYGGGATRGAVCQLLLQSCRLARQAGHLQIAWTFLVEAKALDTSHQAVGMEEARFEFQKGNQSEAIGLLSRLLSSRFSRMHEIFGLFSKQIQSSASSISQPSQLSNTSSISNLSTISSLSKEERSLSAKTLVEQKTTREERAAYAEVQLLRTEYMLKAGAASASDLYQTYIALKRFNVPSEDLHYRVAVFCDNMHSMSDIRSDLVAIVLQSYAEVLQYGRSHLFHAMPRMLTIWLDVSQKLHEDREAERQAHAEKKGDKGGTMAPTMKMEQLTNDIGKMNKEMEKAFKDLPPSAFFTAFPQLISRIGHPDMSVFGTLQIILSSLISIYPHQCLWQSIAVYRDTPQAKSTSLRQERCKKILEHAKQKNKDVGDLVDQYDYVACQLIAIAEKKCSQQTFKGLSEMSKELAAFFRKGEMNTAQLVSASKGRLSGGALRVIKPRVMLPLTEMMEHAMPVANEVKIESSQIDMESAASLHEQPMLQEVFVKDIVEDFLVLQSLQKPKKISLRGTDGRVYSLMCKGGDEMRKDARFMDFSRMMNCLMRRSPEARRRQLCVRTYSVIPLQNRGGIIEWIPNLDTFRGSLSSLFDEYAGKRTTDNELRSNWDDGWPWEKKLISMRDFFYDRFPLVCAEWLRRAFPDPCSWHAARQIFSRSCSVMSMIGFVLGLGDRHADNMLVDQTDGCIIHVDFNLLFDKGEGLRVPEIVPFRLTRNLVDGFGPTGVEGTFRKAAEATIEVMRANADTLLTVLQAFVHDPLVEFADSRAQQNRQTRDQSAFTAPTSAPKGAEYAMQVVNVVRSRLQGHIITMKSSAKRQPHNAPPMSVNGQVSKLIEIASDETNLAKMFSGWSPYV